MTSWSSTPCRPSLQRSRTSPVLEIALGQMHVHLLARAEHVREHVAHRMVGEVGRLDARIVREDGRRPRIVVRQLLESPCRESDTGGCRRRGRSRCAIRSRAGRRSSCPSRCSRRCFRLRGRCGGWRDGWPCAGDCRRTTACRRVRTARRNRCRRAERRMKPVMASMASRDATSPASCPPIPSATANRRTSGSDTNESSLVFRTGPVSVTAHACSNALPSRGWSLRDGTPSIWGNSTIWLKIWTDNTT